jgi:hypothetical protein
VILGLSSRMSGILRLMVMDGLFQSADARVSPLWLAGPPPAVTM